MCCSRRILACLGLVLVLRAHLPSHRMSPPQGSGRVFPPSGRHLLLELTGHQQSGAGLHGKRPDWGRVSFPVRLAVPKSVLLAITLNGSRHQQPQVAAVCCAARYSCTVGPPGAHYQAAVCRLL